MKTPKALLKIGSQTFAECIAGKMVQAGVQPCYLVGGFHFSEIKRGLSRKGQIEFVENPDFEQGQISSLKKGLMEIGPSTRGVVVWPVDQPLVQVETLKKILSAHQQKPNPVTIPVLDARRGHPVVYDREAIDAILSFDATHTAKDLQAIYADRITFVEVDDEGVLIDIDTPEDYEKYVTDSVS